MTARACVIWLQWACGIAFAVGLMAAAGSSSATAGPWLWLFDLLAWPLDGSPAGFDPVTHAVNAVLGGVMVGWASLMYAVVARMSAAGDYTLSLPMLASVLVWFAIDSSGSVAAGLPGNVVLNTGFLLVFVPPLVVLWRREFPEPRDSQKDSRPRV